VIALLRLLLKFSSAGVSQKNSHIGGDEVCWQNAGVFQCLKN
jgi:hypothetical protein